MHAVDYLGWQIVHFQEESVQLVSLLLLRSQNALRNLEQNAQE